MYKIYGLIDCLNNEIFYVGCTQQKYVCKRKCNHIERAKEGKRTSKLYEIIRDLNYEISFVILETFEGDKNLSWKKEQEWIDKLKPIGNTQSARGDPPQQAGHNRIELPKEIIDQFGTMPDYKLAEIAGVSKPTIRRNRKLLDVKSYAQITGNNGKIKKGEEHRRWKK